MVLLPNVQYVSTHVEQHDGYGHCGGDDVFHGRHAYLLDGMLAQKSLGNDDQFPILL